MDSINRESLKEFEFLGLKNLDNSQKLKVFNIINNYNLLLFFLRKRLGLVFADKNLSVVLGILAARDDYSDLAINLGYFFWGNDLELRNDFLDGFDWSKLDLAEKSLEKQMSQVMKISQTGWWIKWYVALRTMDWIKLIFIFAKWFLAGFVLASILYFLVATGWGRDLSWKLLDLYGVIVKMLMVILLVVALVVIVVMVSFMYLEKNSTKK